MVLKMIAMDWRTMLPIQKISMLLWPFIVFFVGLGLGQLMVVPFSLILAMSYAASLFHSEEKVAFNNLYLSMPIKRGQIVTARYVFSLLLMLLGIVPGLLLKPAIRAILPSRWYYPIEVYVAIVAIGVLFFAIMNLFMFPPLFRLGYLKGKILGIYVPAFIMGAFVGAWVIFSHGRDITSEFIAFAYENAWLLSGIAFGAAAVIFVISYVLSLRLYSRRDF